MKLRIFAAAGLLVRGVAAAPAVAPAVDATTPTPAVTATTPARSAETPTTPVAASPPVVTPPTSAPPPSTAARSPEPTAASVLPTTAPPPVAPPVAMPSVAVTARATTAAPIAPLPDVVPSSAVSADVPSTSQKDGDARSRFNVAFNLDNVWYTGKTYDLFSTNDLGASLGLSLGYAVWTNGALSVVPELGFGIDSEDTSNLYGGAVSHTELKTTRVFGGASLRYAVLSFLEPEIRAVVGGTRVDVAVDPSAGPGNLEQSATSPFASLGAGFTLQTPNQALATRTGSLRTLAFGLNVEGGYIGGTSIDVAPAPSPGTGRIATSDAHLGTLSRSGPYLRTALQVRF